VEATSGVAWYDQSDQRGVTHNGVPASCDAKTLQLSSHAEAYLLTLTPVVMMVVPIPVVMAIPPIGAWAEADSKEDGYKKEPDSKIRKRHNRSNE